MTQTIDETMDFCPGMPQERRWFQFYGYGFALIENKTSQTLKVYSYDGADAVAWMCEEMLEIGLHEAEVVHARVNKDNNIYIKIYGSATGFLKGEHVRATCDELTLRCWEVTGGEAGQEVQLKQLADCDYKALITMACYMSPIPPGGRPCAATFPGSAQEYNAVFKANESPSDSETLPPTSPAESIDNKIDLPDNDKQQVATLPDNEKQQVATKDKTPRSRGKWRAVASITLAASAMLMEIAKQAWKALWKGEEIDWSALAFWLKNSVDTIAVNAQKLKETYGKSGGRKLLAILNAVTQLVEFITRLVSSIRYGGAHHWEALTSFLRMVLVIVLLVLEFKVDSNPWWKAWLPVFMVILDVKNIIMRLMELRDDSLNPKKWAILVAEAIGFGCDVAVCFTSNPVPFVLSMSMKGFALAVSMLDGPPGTRDITTVFVTNRFEKPLQVGVYDGTDGLTWCAEKIVLLSPGESTILAARASVSQEGGVAQVFVRYWCDGSELGADMVNGRSAYVITGRTPKLEAVCE